MKLISMNSRTLRVPARLAVSTVRILLCLLSLVALVTAICEVHT